MDDDQITDLKQFIASLITQQTSTIREEVVTDIRAQLRIDLDSLENRLTKKIDDLSIYVGEAMDANNDANEARFKNHEKRIVRLERRAA